jgi:hypothetical protein
MKFNKHHHSSTAEPRVRLKKEMIRRLTSQELTVAAAGGCPTGSATSAVPPTAVDKETNLLPTCG